MIRAMCTNTFKYYIDNILTILGGGIINITQLIKDNQLVSFFILAYSITWTIQIFLPKSFELIGAFGPALAAIIVSFIYNRGRTGISSVKKWSLFVVLFLLLILPIAYNNIYPLPPLESVIAAFLAAFIISGVLSSNKGIHDLLRPLITWRVNLKWYIIIIFLPLLIAIISGLLSGGNFPVNANNFNLNSIIYVLSVFIFGALFLGPLQEEPGWRGFALPILEAKYTPLVATLILGVLWSLWHLGLYINGFYPEGVTGILGQFLFTIPFAFLITWVYNHTRGSLLLVIIMHTSFNTSSGLILGRPTIMFEILMIIVALVIIIGDRMWKELPENDREILIDPDKRAMN